MRLGTISDQQARHWDSRHHAGHSGWHAGRTTTGCAEQEGHGNVCSALPTTAQVQRHTLLHQLEWWPQMCRGGVLPNDAAGHDSSPHAGQQDQVFRGCSAGPVAHCSTHHNAIGMAPQAVNWAIPEQVWECLCILRRPQCVVGLGSLQLAPGNQVRMSKTRH